MGDGLPTDARIEANLLREAVRLREASHMRRRGQSESGVDATCCIPFREGDGSSYGIHRGKLVDGIGDMRGANDHRVSSCPGGYKIWKSSRLRHGGPCGLQPGGGSRDVGGAGMVVGHREAQAGD